jgi:hypothetical protein
MILLALLIPPPELSRMSLTDVSQRSGGQVSLQFFDDYSLLHETNSQYQWIEYQTGLPLNDAFVDLLVSGKREYVHAF